MITYTIQPGDSLSKIASQHGLPWQDLWKANPSIKNPNLIKPGQQLIVPVADLNSQGDAPPARSLEKTLAPLPSMSSAGKSLPGSEAPATDPTTGGAPVGQLTALRLALKTAAQHAYQTGVEQTGKATFDQLGSAGITPVNIAGTAVENILGFVKNSVATPIENTVNTIGTILTQTEQQENAKRDDARSTLTQLNNLIATSGKSWDEVPDEIKQQITQLEKTSGMPIGSMELFAKTKPKANLLATQNGVDGSGNDIISFIYADENGNPGVVQTIKTGGKSKVPGSSGSGGGTVSAGTKAAMIKAALAEVNKPSNRTDQGWLSQDVFLKLRGDFASIAGSTAAFDAAVGPHLNPAGTRQKILGGAGTVKDGSEDDLIN